MARKNLEFPCPGEIRATGEKITLLDEQYIGGIAVYQIKDSDGRTYCHSRSSVIARPSRAE
jgi:hypothetical protein